MEIPAGQLALLDRLAREVPAIAELREAHLRDNDELLPHLLMADVARFVASFFAGGTGSLVPAPSDEALARTLALLDAGMGAGDESVDELVSVSFLENLEGEPYMPELVSRLGPNLGRELERRGAR